MGVATKKKHAPCSDPDCTICVKKTTEQSAKQSVKNKRKSERDWHDTTQIKEEMLQVRDKINKDLNNPETLQKAASLIENWIHDQKKSKK